VQPASAKEPETFVFSFTSSSAARKEQEAITEVLRNAISAIKANSAVTSTTKPGRLASSNVHPDGATQSASMAIAQAVTGRAKTSESDGLYDDAKLKTDIELQRSLLEANPGLRQRFNESLRDKPDSITISQFSSQFWSTRLQMLRAHATEKAQTQGDYNVLPVFQHKRIAVEGQPDKLVINLAKEQIQLLFKQYPVVRQAYSDSVPGIDANQFWSRFFNSRLIRKLRGEKITDADPTDPILDRYLDYTERGPASISKVPNFIDLEGNEQNHSQRQGNRPDKEMRPESGEKVPLLRVLNSLSEKMLSSVTPTDEELHAPVGMDEETYEQLQLRDLQATDKDNRVKLNIREQQSYSTLDTDAEKQAERQRYAQQDTRMVLDYVTKDLKASQSGLALYEALGIQSDTDDSDEEMDDAQPGTHNSNTKAIRIGGSSALEAATTNVMTAVRAKHALESHDDSDTLGLSQTTYDSLVMTHNTTIEFLHYFWSVFLSGDASRVSELERLVETLDKSADRINAVSDAAEKERQTKEDAIKSAMHNLKATSVKARKLTLELESLSGGRKAVGQMIAPTREALYKATTRYKRTYEAQILMT